MHDIGVVFADKYKPGSPHIDRQLVHFAEAAVDHLPAEVWIAKISNDEVISFAYCILMVLEIDTTNPEPVRFQMFD